MNQERRARHGKSSRTLVMTFVLGVGIGFSLCYAMLGGTLGAGVLPLDSFTGTPTPVKKELVPPDVAGLWPGRHLMLGISGTSLDDSAKQMLKRYMPGAVVLREENLASLEQVSQLVLEIKAAMGMGANVESLPLVVLAQEQGPVFHLLGMNNAPTNASLGQINDAGVAGKLGRLYGEALRNIGVAAVFGPMLDIYRPDLGEPALEPYFFSSDKNIVASVGIAFARGLVDAGVVPIVHSYPGMGSAQLTPDGKVVIGVQNITELTELILPFMRAVEQGLPGIMVANAAVPIMDADQPMLPSSMSPKMVKMILRDDFEYTAPIVAADISLDPMTEGVAPGEVVLQALLSGCDAVVLEAPTEEALAHICRTIFDAVEAETLTTSQLEESKARLNQWVRLLERDPAPQQRAPVDSIAHASIDALGQSTRANDVVEREHVVQPGETLTKIAAQYEVSVAEIQSANDLKGELLAGQTLKILVPVQHAAVTPPAPGVAVEAFEEGGTEEEAPTPLPGPQETEETPAPAESAEAIQHTVKPGDTLSSIARQYQVSQEEIRSWNRLSGDTVQAGAVVRVYAAPQAAEGPPQLESYKVVPGDNLRKIAERFATTPEAIMQINKITDPDRIVEGQTLLVPAQPST